MEYFLNEFDANGFAGPFEFEDSSIIEQINFAIEHEFELVTSKENPWLDKLKPYLSEQFSVSPTVCSNTHLSNTDIMALAKDSVITSLIKTLTKTDTFLRRSQLWVKPAFSRAVAWHQDTHKRKHLGDIGERSVWVALDDVTIENGCVWLLKGSHKSGITPPNSLFTIADRINFFNNTEGIFIPPTLEQYECVPMEMKKGQFFIFHQLCFHASGPNKSNDVRRGLALRYIPKSSQQSVPCVLTAI
jgi:ectoine hydroxylase-related dioxygenase (phytanoyl-CoA dioxygenase family)